LTINGGAGGSGGAGAGGSGANLAGTAATVAANATIGPNFGTGGPGGAAGAGGAAGSGFTYDSNTNTYTPFPGTAGHDGTPGAAGLGGDSAAFVRLGVRIGGYVYNRTTHHFTQTVTVTQLGGPTFSSTLAMALDGLPSGVTLTNAAGTTAATLPSGSPYVTVNLEHGPATILLNYADPTFTQIHFIPRLISGAP
jgi:hypothetical protein